MKQKQLPAAVAAPMPMAMPMQSEIGAKDGGHDVGVNDCASDEEIDVEGMEEGENDV